MVEQQNHRVHQLVESYRTSFESLEATAIVRHFAPPCHVTSDMGDHADVAVYDRSAWIEVLTRLVEMYRTIGVRAATPTNLRISPISRRVQQMQVTWLLRDGSGAELYSFECLYTIVERDGELRITAIAHNEMPRYRECLARLRGSTRTA